MTAPTDRTGTPLGHSRSAHRVLGWCSHCPDHDPFEEVLAWRTRENTLHDTYETQRLTPPGPYLEATRGEDQQCPACRETALTVVTMRAIAEDGSGRPAGGWAICNACGATPHPTWEEQAHGR